MEIRNKIFSVEILNALNQLDLSIDVKELPNKPFRPLNEEERTLMIPYVCGSNMDKIIKLKVSNRINIIYFFDDSDDITTIWVSKKA